ncbi:deoxyribonuclease IV [Hutsoniella sourekii]
MYIGSHVSFKGEEMLLGAAKQAASYGANVFMVYTGAPQNTQRKSIDSFRIREGHEYMRATGIETLTVHAPYIVNLANTTKPGYHDFAIDFLQEELRRAHALGASQVTLHPGAHVGAGVQKGLDRLIHGLNEVIDPSLPVQIALETMAGKGTELGRNFEELAEIIAGVTHNEKLSVTFDTCHVYDAGYDIKNQLDQVLKDFDRVIGLDRIQVIHINDSKNPIASHKDRHANIGYGHLGFDCLNQIVHLSEFKEIPKILETPWLTLEPGSKKKVAPYKEEIDMFKKSQFNPELFPVNTFD